MPARPDSAPRGGAAPLTLDGGAAAPRSTALFAGVEPLEVFVDLLSAVEAATPASDFYDRICEAVCRLTTMRRAAIFRYDPGRRRVAAVGSHGASFAKLEAVRVTLADAPIAQRALRENRVVVVSDRIEEAVPAEYARILGITTLVCTPLSAADRWFGVICADRGGGRFTLTDGERHLMWTLGKIAALAASARIATRQQERARRLSERLALAREVHERVLQRLFGVSLALSAERRLSPRERNRCRTEMADALADLRTALQRPLEPARVDPGATLRGELARLSLAADGPPLEVSWPDGLELPAELEPLAQTVVAEALRNVGKHADARLVRIALARERGALSLEVRNDGARPARARVTAGAGMGLRLAAFDALEHGGIVEFGPVTVDGGPGWRVRLVVPAGP